MFQGWNSLISRIFAGLLGAAALSAFRAAHADTWYRLQEIAPPVGAVVVATDISNSGQVVGGIQLPAGSAGFSYFNGSLTVLTPPVAHTVFSAIAVNNAGQITGSVTSEFGIPKSALWLSASDSAPLVLESGGGPDANVYTTGINNAGVICGYYTGSGSGNVSSWRAVKWIPDGDRMRQRVLTTGVTPLPPGVFHAAYGINDAGLIVGTGAWDDPDLLTSQAAVLWDANDQPFELSPLIGADPAPRFHAYSINESGVAVGVIVNNNGSQRGLKWLADGSVVDLGPAPPFTDSAALEISEAGVVVGTLNSATASAGAVHENGAWVDLNSRLIDAPGWSVHSAVGVNASGQIVGQALFAGVNRAVILTPSTLPGDVNNDGMVDLADLTLLLSSFGTCATDAGYCAACDFDGSGCIALGDLTVLLANFGV